MQTRTINFVLEAWEAACAENAHALLYNVGRVAPFAMVAWDRNDGPCVEIVATGEVLRSYGEVVAFINAH